ncbi:hypothetical protein BBF93_04790 [Hyphomonas sp. CACIAM 19H1]|nr:hypothetical protein BBF93_04790 [Hyphomonas sp. CACIAM 19H1]
MLAPDGIRLAPIVAGRRLQSAGSDGRRAGWRGLSRAILSAFLLGVLPGCVGSLQAEEQSVHVIKRPATIEDMLQVEFIGPADFSPDGRWLAYTLVPPYEKIGDYSYWLRASGLSGHKILLRDLSTSGVSRAHPGLNPSASQYLIGFSPSGSHLMVLEHSRGSFVLAACPVAGADCKRFASMPDIRDMYVAPAAWNERLIWTDDFSFLLPVRPRDLPGSELRNRAGTADYLVQAWNDAWSGSRPTGSVAQSRRELDANAWDAGGLVRFDIRTGREQLIGNGRHAGGQLSPDRRYLLISKAGERRRPPADAAPQARETHPMFDRLYALGLMDLMDNSVRELTCDCNLDPDSVAWGASGQAFAYFAWPMAGPVESGRYRLVERASGELILETPADYELADRRDPGNREHPAGPVRAAPAGTGLIAFARKTGTARYDWFYFDRAGRAENLSAKISDPAGEIIHLLDNGVQVLAKDGVYRLVPGRPAEAFPGLPAGPIGRLVYRSNTAHGWANEFFFRYQRTRLDPAPRINLMQFGPDGDSAIAMVDLSDPTASPIVARPGLEGARVLAAGPGGELLVTVKDGSATRLLLTGRKGEAMELARINRHLNHLLPPSVRRLSYTLSSQNGEQRRVDGCLLLPPDYQPGRRYPVVIDVYPVGCAPACRSLGDMPWVAPNLADLWTSRGFIYMMPPVPLDMVATPEGPIAGLDDLLEQTLDVLVSEGLADPGRAVLYGFSQGGAASLYVATQSDRFAATISMNGWADFFSHYFSGRGLMRYFHLDQNGGDNRWRYECLGTGADHRCPFGFGESALDDPEAYARSSPVALARGVSAPVLLIHSDWDYFDMSQYDEMFGALYRAGKEARYVRYWGEGHGPSSPANLRDLWHQTDAFLIESGVLPAVCEDQPCRK